VIRRHLTWIGIAATLSMGCNALTGADDVDIDDDGGGAANGGPTLAFADGVVVEAVTMTQGVRRPLMENGQPVSDQDVLAPIVAGRDALFRISYSTNAALTDATMTARVTIGESEPVDQEVTLSMTPSDLSVLSSTANVLVPGDRIAELTDYRVELLQADDVTSGDNVAAAYPATGREPLNARSTGSALKVLLIPVAYMADGSGRLPDTSAAQIEILREKFYQRYPTPAVDIRIGETFTWNQPVSGNGAGLSELLDAMVQFRTMIAADDDEHMYGMFNAADSMSEFCAGGCITGLSSLGSPPDPLSRVGIGVGFGGEGAAETAVHEVGHQQGRGHVDCGGAGNPDPDYPYPDGAIGSWGYDLVNEVLVEPMMNKDFMSYCDPTWVSDYNFRNIFGQLMQVNMLDLQRVATPRSYARVRVGRDGQLAWLEPLSLTRTPAGQAVTLQAELASGQVKLQAQRYRYSHLDGGYLLFEAPRGLRAIRVELHGRVQRLTR
jgi:hypothetical protein